MIDVLGVVNPITAIGTATNNVPTTIAFQALDAFLPTHTPAIVGKKIVMIVRGICCLRAGIKGLSEHIRVRSIVGTFLEHSRIFYFENNGNAEYYMGSADWMPRNLDKRVEILFPVEDPILQEEIYHILHIQLSDTKKAHLLMPDGQYVKVDQRGKTPLNSQLYFCEEAMANAKK